LKIRAGVRPPLTISRHCLRDKREAEWLAGEIKRGPALNAPDFLRPRPPIRFSFAPPV